MTRPLAVNRLDELIAHQDLTNLVARWARGVDRGDEELIASCYVEDSLDDHGRFRGTGREFARYICQDSELARSTTCLHHCLGQSLFEIGVERATGETYYVCYIEAGLDRVFQGVGRYLDDFVLRDGRWLIERRRVVMEWSGYLPAEVVPLPPEAIAGRRSRLDPSYVRTAVDTAGRRACGTGAP